MSRKIVVSVLLVIAVAAGSGPAFAAKLVLVANNGMDTQDCGTSLHPCRSVGQGITMVDEGGTVFVGPGRYGDLNNDGDFDDPGEEFAEIDSGCNCMIHVDKKISLFSTSGSAATVLDAGGSFVDVVAITADEVNFGGNNRGFYITGAQAQGDERGAGVVVRDASGVKIRGNHAASNDAEGFLIFGDNHSLENNLASANGAGFSFAFTEKGHLIRDNSACNNGNNTFFGNGFSITGNRYTILKNKASANKGIGFLINSQVGNGLKFRENSIIGNRGVGIWVSQGPGLSLRRNKIFGNLGEQVFHQSEALNCGLVNDSGQTIDAAWNYWGAISGPGPDPADAAGPGTICDRNGTTIVEPFAIHPVGP